MVLVFILLGIIILILFITIISLLSTIKIQIKKLKLENKNLQRIDKINNKYQIKIGIYFLNKIPIFSKKINAEQIKKISSNKKLEKIDFKKVKNKIKIKDILKIIKILQIKIKDLKLRIDIGTENAILTSYLIAFISSVIGILLPQITEKNNIQTCSYIVNPRYRDKNEYYININCIIYVKIVHIICSFLYFIKKGRDRNERTSNRRAYAYSHE